VQGSDREEVMTHKKHSRWKRIAVLVAASAMAAAATLVAVDMATQPSDVPRPAESSQTVDTPRPADEAPAQTESKTEAPAQHKAPARQETPAQRESKQAEAPRRQEAPATQEAPAPAEVNAEGHVNNDENLTEGPGEYQDSEGMQEESSGAPVDKVREEFNDATLKIPKENPNYRPAESRYIPHGQHDVGRYETGTRGGLPYP
jgi:hypothetical protein